MKTTCAVLLAVLMLAVMLVYQRAESQPKVGDRKSVLSVFKMGQKVLAAWTPGGSVQIKIPLEWREPGRLSSEGFCFEILEVTNDYIVLKDVTPRKDAKLAHEYVPYHAISRITVEQKE